MSQSFVNKPFPDSPCLIFTKNRISDMFQQKGKKQQITIIKTTG